MGPGPYTPVKDVQTPLPHYGMFCTSYTDTDDVYTHPSTLYRCVHPVLRVTGVQDLRVSTGSHTWTATVTTIVNIAIIIKLIPIVVKRIRRIIRSGTMILFIFLIDSQLKVLSIRCYAST